MIRRSLIVAGLLGPLFFIAPRTVAAEGTPGYASRGFEAPQFKPGSVEGQDGWRIPAIKSEVAPEGAVIQSAHVHEGTQALHLRNTGRRAVARLPVTAGSEFYLDFWFSMPAGEQILNNPEFIFRGRKQSGEFGDFLITQFSKSGRIPDMPNAGEYRLLPGQWNRLTFRINPAQATWDLYVNGSKIVDNETSKEGVPFSAIEYIDFSWTGESQFPDGGVFIDDLTVSTELPQF